MRFAAVVVLALAVVAVSALPRLDESEYQAQFVSWVAKFNKAYETEEMFGKYATFKDNLNLIRKHNAGGHNLTFTLGLNQFADMNRAEFKAFVKAGTPPNRPVVTQKYVAPNPPAPAKNIDWRANGAVTPVKNQGQCGSCWAFSTAGTLESWNVINLKNPLTSLSEQELVDCATDQCFGCNGGWPYKAMEFVETNGLCSEADYPYTGTDGTCQSSSCTPTIPPNTLKGYTQMATEDDMSTAIQTGPISVLVEADTSAFQFYQSGVMNDKSCGTQIDHAIINVGVSMSAGGKNGYWIVKNSWGASWGAEGYIFIERDNNICGISQTPTQPVYA